MTAVDSDRRAPERAATDELIQEAYIAARRLHKALLRDELEDRATMRHSFVSAISSYVTLLEMHMERR
jgi:hypothetical protein